uniref:Uncharacterized protein n=1 Tax=Otus sunia TaxID=257818 RepID=A0A8C8E6C7_9STRI
MKTRKVICGTSTFCSRLRPKGSASARPRPAACMSGASVCTPEQDTERGECHWQAELPRDGASPGLTTHPKAGKCLWNWLKSQEQTASHGHLSQLSHGKVLLGKVGLHLLS